MEEQANLSKQDKFPGEVGNLFDQLLRKTVELQKIPALLLAVALLLWAWLLRGGFWPQVLVLWGFFLLDWVLLWLLPKTGRSFGPDRPIVLILAAMRAPFALLPPLAALLFQVAGTLLVISGFWIEPHRLTVTRLQLRTAKLPTGARFTMLHLGDLHIERITQRERHLNQLVGELRPDLILFSGDFLNLSYNEDPQAWEQCRAVVREWQAPLGVYVVTGSPAVDLEQVIPSLLEGLPLRWLQDEKVRLDLPGGGGSVDLIGLSCTHRPDRDSARLVPLAADANRHFTILLHHTPDLAPETAKMKIDLQLSGHTHGGQVRLPGYGALFAASLYGKRFEAGRYQLDQTTLYVTRGIGLEGQGAPRVRLFCPPEIILWEISGTSQQSGEKR